MPGFMVHTGATVLCTHGAPAQPTAPNPRVTVSGQPISTITAPYLVTGCPFNISGAPSPCVTGQWLMGTVRVTASGQPIVIQSSQAICTPNGTPLLILVTQPRVTAT